MSSETKVEDGGPAFPQGATEDHVGNTHPLFGGITIRDYFAGQALSAVLKNGADRDALDPEAQSNFFEIAAGFGPTVAEVIAWKAYAIADAMLEARKKGPTP